MDEKGKLNLSTQLSSSTRTKPFTECDDSTRKQFTIEENFIYEPERLSLLSRRLVELSSIIEKSPTGSLMSMDGNNDGQEMSSIDEKNRNIMPPRPPQRTKSKRINKHGRLESIQIQMDRTRDGSMQIEKKQLPSTPSTTTNRSNQFTMNVIGPHENGMENDLNYMLPCTISSTSTTPPSSSTPPPTPTPELDHYHMKRPFSSPSLISYKDSVQISIGDNFQTCSTPNSQSKSMSDIDQSNSAIMFWSESPIVANEDNKKDESVSESSYDNDDDDDDDDDDVMNISSKSDESKDGGGQLTSSLPISFDNLRSPKKLFTTNSEALIHSSSQLPAIDSNRSTSMPSLQQSNNQDIKIECNATIEQSISNSSLSSSSPSSLQQSKESENNQSMESNVKTVKVETMKRIQDTKKIVSNQNNNNNNNHRLRRRPSTLIQITNPSYKSKCEDFRTIFCDQGIPIETEQLIADFSCAYYDKILLQGRIYITKHYFAFYANWVNLFEKWNVIKCSDVRSLSKANTMMVIPNAIHVHMNNGEKHIFASFGARDKSFEVMTNVWNAVIAAQAANQAECLSNCVNAETAIGRDALLEPSIIEPQPLCSKLTDRELWIMVKSVYGNNLGLSAKEEIEMQGFSPLKINNISNNNSSSSSSNGSSSSNNNNNNENSFSHNTIAEVDEEKNKEYHVKHDMNDRKNIDFEFIMLNENTPIVDHNDDEAIREHLTNQSIPGEGELSLINSKLGGIEKSKSNNDLIEPITVTGITKSKMWNRQSAPMLQLNTSSSSISSSSESNVPNVIIRPPPRPPSRSSSRSPSLKKVKIVSSPVKTLPSSCTVINNVPGKCCCTQHLEKIVLDQIYPIDLDLLYKIVYEDHADGCNEDGHPFLERVLRSRATDDLTATQWKQLSGEERNDLPKQMRKLSVNIMDDINLDRLWKRELNFTVQLNHVMCRQTFTREQQFRLQYDVGQAFVVYSQARNESVPYSDSFVVNTSWCGTNVPKRGTRLIIRFQISWIKSSLSLSMLKSTIEKSSFQGVADYHRDMFKLLDDDLATGRLPIIQQQQQQQQQHSQSDNDDTMIGTTNGPIPNIRRRCNSVRSNGQSQSKVTNMELSNTNVDINHELMMDQIPSRTNATNTLKLITNSNSESNGEQSFTNTNQYHQTSSLSFQQQTQQSQTISKMFLILFVLIFVLLLANMITIIRLVQMEDHLTELVRVIAESIQNIHHNQTQ